MLPRKIAIQFLNYGHQVGIKACNLDTGVSKPLLAPTAYQFVRIENPDKDLPDAPLNYSFGTGNLWTVSTCAWL
jgi:hypothetical protein